MLHALLRSKTGRADLRDTPFHAGALHRYEDPLTAAVFERLAYLPDGLMVDLLRSAWRAPLSGARFPANPGPLRSHAFWPTLRLDAETRVEPDLVLRFAEAVLVVEAKHRTSHHASQWTREVLATRRSTELPVWLLAVGSTPSEEAARSTVEEAGASGVLHATWVSLGRAVRLYRSHPKLPPSQGRVLDDVLLALRASGYGPRTRMATLVDYVPRPPRALRTSLSPWSSPS